MLNVGLPELTLIGLLALIVVGPERLPGLARTAAGWLATFRREAGRSIAELRSAAEIDDIASEVSTLRRELRATRSEIATSLAQPASTVQDVVKGVSPGGPTDRRGEADRGDGPVQVDREGPVDEVPEGRATDAPQPRGDDPDGQPDHDRAFGGAVGGDGQPDGDRAVGGDRAEGPGATATPVDPPPLDPDAT